MVISNIDTGMLVILNNNIGMLALLNHIGIFSYKYENVIHLKAGLMIFQSYYTSLHSVG